MTDTREACCCTADQPVASPSKLSCPHCASACKPVAANTIRLHLLEPWKWRDDAGQYAFCGQTGCEVVYFGDDGSVITQQALRTRVGQKSDAPDALLCYCFGITREAASHDPGLREYVIAQTRAGHCDCESLNPSGRCCLETFTKSGDWPA